METGDAENVISDHYLETDLEIEVDFLGISAL